MRSIRSRVIAGVIVAVAAAAVAAIVPAGAKARTPSHDGTVRSMVALARADAHLPAVYSSPALDAVAKRQSERMRSAGRIFHNPQLADDVNASRLAWSVAGENVGVGPSIADVHRAFMASPSHRANILNGTYNAIGTHVATAPDGRLYVTQVFAKLVRTPCDRYLIIEDGSLVRPSSAC